MENRDHGGSLIFIEDYRPANTALNLPFLSEMC